MIVIVEGPNGKYKDILIKHLRNCYFKRKATIFKFSNMSDFSIGSYESCLDYKDDNIIMDGFNLLNESLLTIDDCTSQNNLLDHLKVMSKVEDLDAVYFIFYSSSMEVLDRSYKALCVDYPLTFDELYSINQYYMDIGKELRKLYPRNIKLIDIASTSVTTQFIEDVLNKHLEEVNFDE